MIRFLRLYLWLRWRLFVGHLREAKAKGRFSQLGVVLGVFALGFVGVLLLAASMALAVLGAAGADALAGADVSDRAATLLMLRLMFLALTGLLLVMPAVRAGRGSFGKSSGGLTRLLLLPLPRGRLHASEVIGNALDPFILTFLPGLLVLGLLLGSQLGGAGALVAVAACLLMLLSLMAWSALLGIGLQLLFRDRRRAERALLVLFLGWIGFSMLPGFLESAKEKARAQRDAVQEPAAPLDPEPPVAAPARDETAEERIARKRRERLELTETFPVWLQPLPSEAFVRTLSVVSTGRTAAALPSLAMLAAFAAGCWALSLRLWNRLIGSPESGSGGAAVDPSKLRLRRLPGVSSQTAGVAFATARGFLRTVRGKLGLAMTPMMVLMFGYMFRTGEQSGLIEGLFGSLTGALGSFAILMSLLSVLPISANAFASDRAGFTLQALAPISETRLVWGKALGCLLVHLACMVPALVAVQLWSSPDGVAGFLDSIALGVAAFAFSIPACLWFSVLFPKHADLSSLGNEGNPHQLAQLVTMVVIALGMGLASVGGWAGQSLLGSSAWGRLLGTCVTGALAWLLAWPLLSAAAGALQQRWETVLMTAQGR